MATAPVTTPIWLEEHGQGHRRELDSPIRHEARRLNAIPAIMVMMFLKDTSGPKAVALQAAITGPELVRARGREAHVVHPNGIGRSRLTHALIEKALGTRGTGRNWNTVLKLGVLAGSRSMARS